MSLGACTGCSSVGVRPGSSGVGSKVRSESEDTVSRPGGLSTSGDKA